MLFIPLSLNTIVSFGAEPSGCPGSGESAGSAGVPSKRQSLPQSGLVQGGNNY